MRGIGFNARQFLNMDLNLVHGAKVGSLATDLSNLINTIQKRLGFLSLVKQPGSIS